MFSRFGLVVSPIVLRTSDGSTTASLMALAEAEDIPDVATNFSANAWRALATA
jgi:hypothetical protein